MTLWWLSFDVCTNLVLSELPNEIQGALVLPDSTDQTQSYALCSWWCKWSAAGFTHKQWWHSLRILDATAASMLPYLTYITRNHPSTVIIPSQVNLRQMTVTCRKEKRRLERAFWIFFHCKITSKEGSLNTMHIMCLSWLICTPF